MVTAPMAPPPVATAPSRPVSRRRPARAGLGAELHTSLAAAAALSAAAGVAWASTFKGAHAVPALVAAAVVPAGLVAATASRSGAVVRSLLSAGLALVAIAVATGGLDAAVSGLSGGWSDVLTTALPIDAGDPTFALALSVTWLAAALSAELVAGTARPLAPVLPPLAGLVAALAVGAPGPSMPGAVVTLICFCAAVLVAVRTSHLTRRHAARIAREAGEDPKAGAGPGAATPTRSPSPGPLLAGLGVAVAVAVAAAAVGSRPPGVDAGERFDVRRYRNDPVVPQGAANPLAGFAALVASPDQEVARVTGGKEGLLLRLAVLDSFDGATWTSSGTYARASTTLPSPAEAALATDEVKLDVHVADLDGFFLPAPDRPTRVSVDGLGVDLGTGVLIAPERARGMKYEVTSKVPRFTAIGLRGATQARTATPLKDLPRDLADRARDLTAQAGTAFGKPAALVRHFETGGYVLVTGASPPSGHGYYNLLELFADRRGTAEQYASAVAVLARAVGYDTRVVVGFRLPRPGSGGVARVNTGDAHAWAEVRFEDLGWVRFDPVPAGTGAGDDGSTPPTTAAPEPAPGAPVPTTVAADPLKRAIEESPNDPVTPPGGDRGPATAASAGDSSSPVPWLLGIAAGLTVSLGLLVGAVVWAKRSRRRRRRVAGEPSALVQGAWHETLDRLAEHGLKPARSMSTTDVVRAAGQVVDGALVPPLEALAGLANVARFDARGASSQQATTAWAAADAVTTGLRTGCSRARRLTAAVSPAPLLTRRRS